MSGADFALLCIVVPSAGFLAGYLFARIGERMIRSTVGPQLDQRVMHWPWPDLTKIATEDVREARGEIERLQTRVDELEAPILALHQCSEDWKIWDTLRDEPDCDSPTEPCPVCQRMEEIHAREQAAERRIAELGTEIAGREK